MKIGFYYEFGQKKEIGTGHKYRSYSLRTRLASLGHDTVGPENLKDLDVLVVDHIFSQKETIDKFKSQGAKVVLIDGAEEDTNLVDLSISPFFNKKAEYRGVEYMVIPSSLDWDKYRVDLKSKTIFVGMGGFDANNVAEDIIQVSGELGFYALVAKSINHDNFKYKYNNVEIFNENDYYTAMKECRMGVTNGGLTLFQSLHYGLPTLAIPQYVHQEENIKHVQHCCYTAKTNDRESIKEHIRSIMNNEGYRTAVSALSKKTVDGKGCERVCALIEKLGE